MFITDDGTQPETSEVETNDAPQSDVEGSETNEGSDGNEGAETKPATEDGQEDFVGNVPKELETFKKDILKAFYKKTEALAAQRKEIESVKSKAELMEQLYNYPKFREWYEHEQKVISGEAPAKEETMSEEQLEELKSDPVKFQKYMMDQMNNLIESKLGNGVKQTQAQLEEMRERMEVEKEYKTTSSKFSDFDDLSTTGLLDDYLDKGFSYEEAYKMYKFDNQSDPERVRKVKEGSTQKPSPMHSQGSEVIVKGKSFDDVFDNMFSAKAAGKKARYSKE